MSLTRVWSANTSRMYSAGARCSIACPSLPRCSRSIARSLSHHFQSLASMGNAPSLGVVTVTSQWHIFYVSSPIDRSACPTNAYLQPVSRAAKRVAQGILSPPASTSRASPQSSPIPRLLIISHSELSRPDQFVVLTVHSPTCYPPPER